MSDIKLEFREIIDHLNDALVVYSAVDNGEDFVILDFNAAAERIDHVKRGNVIGQKVTKVFPSIKEFGLLDILKKVFVTGRPAHYPATFYKDNRISGWRDNYIYKVSNGCVIAVYSDVTEAKEAEIAFKTQFEFIQNVIDSIPNPVFYKDTEGKYTWCNKAFSEFCGIPKKDIIGKTVFDISDKALAEVYHQKDEELFREPGFQQYESLVQNRNGVLRTVMFYKTPHTRYDGKVIGLIGVIVDVTELKRTALELRESEERFRSIMDNIGIGVALISPKMEILTLNRTMLKWFPDLEFQKNPICYKAFNKPARKGPCEYCPTIKTFKDGLIHEAVTETPLGDEVVNYRVVASPVKNEKGEVTAVIEMVEDITEKNKNEQKLKMMNAEWDRTFNAISDFIFLQDKDGTVARVNSALAEFFKVKPEELVGKKCYEIMHNRNQPWPDCPMEQTKKDHKPHTIEVDDTNIGLPLLVTTSPIFSEKGEYLGTVHISKDISQQKNMQAELQKRIDTLERFQALTIDREIKMKELKSEVARLKLTIDALSKDSTRGTK